MKTKNIFILILVASSFFATAQQKQKRILLPEEATTFLEAYFKGIQLQDVKKDFEGDSFKYEVKLDNGSEIDFDSRGRWQEMESKTVTLPISMLQNSVIQYINKNYAGAKITKVKKGNRFNFVEINDETMLQFDTEGNFYKILVD